MIVHVCVFTGINHLSEKRRERSPDDVRETRAMGIHLPELRLHEPHPGPDPIHQWEAPRGGESRAVLRTIRVQRQVSYLRTCLSSDTII